MPRHPEVAGCGERRAAFYWLGLSDRGLDGPVRLSARLVDRGVKLSATPGEGGAFGDSRIQVMLDDGMVDLDAPLVIEVNGRILLLQQRQLRHRAGQARPPAQPADEPLRRRLVVRRHRPARVILKKCPNCPAQLEAQR